MGRFVPEADVIGIIHENKNTTEMNSVGLFEKCKHECFSSMCECTNTLIAMVNYH
jgi:hypothetical protein